MNKHFIWLFAAVLGLMYSCSDDNWDGNKNQGMVNFTVSTSIPQSIQTYASHNGGATNVDASQYDLRYILEAWTDDGRLAYRGYQIVTDNFTTTDVTFSARLLALKYKFVFWADFVPDGSTADYYYSTCTASGLAEAVVDADAANVGNGLTEIKMLTPPPTSAYSVSNDARDAYYAVKEVDLRNENVIGSVTLYRPFGKFRLIATGTPDGFLSVGTVPKAEIQYKGAASPVSFPSGFNALTGTIDNTTTVDVSAVFVSDVKQETVVAGGVTYTNAYVLAFDYIFAPKAPNAQVINFDATVYDGSSTPNKIGFREISNIPLAENKLTTIIGDFFTHAAVMHVIVSDPFTDEEVIDIGAWAEIPGNITADYEIVIPKDAQYAGAYMFTGNVSAGVKITVVDEDPGTPYQGEVTVYFKNPTTATVIIDAAGATASVIGNIGNLEITAAKAINVDMKYSNITATTISNSSTAKVFWHPYNGDQLRSALGCAANVNSGVVLEGDCSFDVNGGIIAEQSSFIIGLSDHGSPTPPSKTYTGYVFDGNGHTISGNAPNQVLVCYTDDATIKNVTIKPSVINGSSGLLIFNSTGVTLEKVKAINGKAGIVINGAEVTADGIETSGNSWGGVNIDKTSGVSVTPDFTLLSGTFAETNPVWSENEGTPNKWVTTPAGWTYFEVAGSTTILYYPVPAGAIVIGSTVYTTLVAAATAATSGQTINVGAGTFNVAELVIPPGVTLKGAGKDATILLAPNTSAVQYTVRLGNAAILQDVWVRYNPSRMPGTAWNSENPGGVDIGTNSQLLNSRVTGHRNGVYANNVSGFTISDNDISANRTGLQLANGAYGTVSGNAFNDNETMGVLLLPSSELLTTVPTFKNNTFSGNWSSDFENRWANTYVVTLDNTNTFSGGTKTIQQAADSSEGSSAATFTKSSVTFVANIVTSVSANVQ